MIRGYRAEIEPKSLDLRLLAFIFIRSNDRPGVADTPARLAEIPEILELHHVAGEDCYLAKVRAPDAEALGRLLRDRLERIPIDHLDPHDDRPRVGEGDRLASRRARRRRREGVAWLTHPSTDLPPEC